MTQSKIWMVLFILSLAIAFTCCIFINRQATIETKPGAHANQHEQSRHSKQHDIEGFASVIIDPERVQLLGISTEKIKVRNLKKKVRTVGIVTPDETRVSHIQTKFTGWIEQLFVDFIGMPVILDQPLFSVYSPELLATQEEYLLALKDINEPIHGRFAQELRKASQELLCATHERLALWDVPEEQIKKLEQEKTPTKTLVIRSPVCGVVLDKSAFVGMNVGPGITTYSIADLSRIWILTDIYEDDISQVSIGQKAKLNIQALPTYTFYGKVTFIDYVLDSSTRTTKARFEFDNIENHLKPGMFGTVTFSLKVGKHTSVPEEAIIDTGKRKIVFIALGSGHYEPRQITTGIKAGKYYQVLKGLVPGEDVVTSSQFLLDSESRLQSIGSGGMKGHGM